MDDLRRPGAVLGPKTVPKRTQNLVGDLLNTISDSEAEDLLHHVHYVWPNQLYGEIES